MCPSGARSPAKRASRGFAADARGKVGRQCQWNTLVTHRQATRHSCSLKFTAKRVTHCCGENVGLSVALANTSGPAPSFCETEHLLRPFASLQTQATSLEATCPVSEICLRLTTNSQILLQAEVFAASPRHYESPARRVVYICLLRLLVLRGVKVESFGPNKSYPCLYRLG